MGKKLMSMRLSYLSLSAGNYINIADVVQQMFDVLGDYFFTVVVTDLSQSPPATVYQNAVVRLSYSDRGQMPNLFIALYAQGSTADPIRLDFTGSPETRLSVYISAEAAKIDIVEAVRGQVTRTLVMYEA